MRQSSHHFSAHVYCGEINGWIKMSLGTEVGLSPCDNVLDGNPAPHGKATESIPTYSPLCSVTDAHLSNYTVSGKKWNHSIFAYNFAKC